MDWKLKRELEEKKEKLMSEYWQIVDPNNEGAIISKNNFVRELNELCNLQANYAHASERLDEYTQRQVYDKKFVEELEDDVLAEQVEFYSAFVAFVKKFESESSRVHSAMGSKTSELKKKTSAENGKKGGRPRKKAE